MVNKKEFYSVKEVADLIGVSRVAVFKWIQQNKIRAEKVGRNYIIPSSEIEILRSERLSQNSIDEINEAVHRVISEYGETLRLLAKE